MSRELPPLPDEIVKGYALNKALLAMSDHIPESLQSEETKKKVAALRRDMELSEPLINLYNDLRGAEAAAASTKADGDPEESGKTYTHRVIDTEEANRNAGHLWRTFEYVEGAHPCIHDPLPGGAVLVLTKLPDKPDQMMGLFPGYEEEYAKHEECRAAKIQRIAITVTEDDGEVIATTYLTDLQVNNLISKLYAAQKVLRTPIEAPEPVTAD